MLSGNNGSGLQTKKSIKQGGTDNPYLWNLVLRSIAAPLVQSWETLGYGIILENGARVTHFLWSDNLYLVGASLERTHAMAQSSSVALNRNGLSWKPASLQHLGTNLEAVYPALTPCV